MSNEEFERPLSTIKITNTYPEKVSVINGSWCSVRSSKVAIQSVQNKVEVYPEVWSQDDESTQIDVWTTIPDELYREKYSEEKVIESFRKQSNLPFKFMLDKELNHLVSLVLEHERLISLGMINDTEDLKTFRNDLFLIFDQH